MLNQPLATKYRPKNFTELKGQNVLVRILGTAINSSKLANAYMLTGIRGIGKTTTARIIAKTINCTNLKNVDNVPVPCEECKNCVSINSFSHPDIIEIDAASKTGVNDIRELIENAKYKPLLGTYKVYIIDEMHMLSNSAFNALLKTLEEPPENVLFIFATTEIQKIPATVISRCQRFDLLRLSFPDIANHIEEISKKENIKYTKEGIDLIAKFSEGSVRDSLSLLETMNLYKEPTEAISALLVSEVLGAPKAESLYSLIENIISGNSEASLKIAQDLYHEGIELNLVIEELLQICNKISKSIIIKGFTEKGEVFEYEKPLLQQIKSRTDILSITNIWKLLFNGSSELKNSSYPLSVLEMVIIRACYLSKLPSLDSVMRNALTKPAIATPNATKNLDSFQMMVDLFYREKELLLYKQLTENIQIINYKHGTIEAKSTKHLSSNFVHDVSNLLNKWTGDKWKIVLLNQDNPAKVEKTLQEQELDIINSNDIVQAVYNNFPGSKITKISKATTN